LKNTSCKKVITENLVSYIEQFKVPGTSHNYIVKNKGEKGYSATRHVLEKIDFLIFCNLAKKLRCIYPLNYYDCVDIY